jgi:hypothetical protein
MLRLATFKMPFCSFRLPPGQVELEFVTVISDDGKVRAFARIPRDLLEDDFKDADYARPWIPERSATRLREADLNILSKLGK